MSDLPRSSAESTPSYRLNTSLNDDLMNGGRSQVPGPRPGASLTLPNPVFPSNPKLFETADEAYLPMNGKRHYTVPEIYHSMKGWMFPYFRSRLERGEFHPIIAYLFNEWKCNLDCNYCWAFDNRVKGMSEDIARRSIDWLHSTTCRVLALIQMEDELAASIAIQGAVWGGAKAFTVTSGPGFSLMMEHIGYAAMTETPCVFVNVQRGGPSTGLPTLPAQADMMQAKWGSDGDYSVIALC